MECCFAVEKATRAWCRSVLGWSLLGCLILLFCSTRSLRGASGPYASAPAVAEGTFPPRGKKLRLALQRAETAWRQLQQPRLSPDALADAQARYARAVGEAIANLNGAAKAVLPGRIPTWDWHKPGMTLQIGGYRLALASGASAPGTWTPGLYDEVWWVDQPARNPAVPNARRAGVGAALLAVRKRTERRQEQEPGMPSRGYRLPATGVLDFGPPGRPGGATTVQVRIFDPRVVRQIPVDRERTLPLAADFATPARQSVGVRNFGLLALLGFFRPERALDYSGTFLFEPYRPDKIPVVFIHGLNSDPSIWENATAEIMADPELGPRCQFWYFFYPTGSPVPSSAERLRASLDQLRAHYDPAGDAPDMDRLILVGHSMGGLLAHLQVVEPGTQMYDAYFRVPPGRLGVPASFQRLLHSNLLFSARRDVGQVVFICTPHRGSRIADWGAVRLLARLVAVPEKILTTATQILTLNTDLLSPEMARSGLRGFTSLDSLSPRNPYYTALEKLPIRRPFDTILGDRGRGDTPSSSDGVVGYRSAHWDGAGSETVVPYGHQCAMKPQVCEQLDRILRRDILGRAAAAHPGSRAVSPDMTWE